jgi:hypothetical protein
MGKNIKFNFEGKEYVLEFNRKAIEMMEKRGFIAEDAIKTPLTSLPVLFNGAFQTHHKGITLETTNKMLDNLKDTTGLISKLTEMYNEPILALIDDTDEKNIEWEANW